MGVAPVWGGRGNDVGWAWHQWVDVALGIEKRGTCCCTSIALEALQPKTAQVSKQQVVAMVTEPEVPAEPPPEYEFMVDPPAISRRHL